MKLKEFILGMFASLGVTFVIGIIMASILGVKHSSPIGTPKEKDYCLQYLEMSIGSTPAFCLKYFK